MSSMFKIPCRLVVPVLVAGYCLQSFADSPTPEGMKDNSFRSADPRRTAPPFADDTRTTVTPYALAIEEISKLEQSALAGDCAAAFRLGKHHSFFSLNHAAAVRWLRLAAKCPNANAKGDLIALLRELPEHSLEVDQLVREITELDPVMGKHEAEAVRDSREGQKNK